MKFKLNSITKFISDSKPKNYLLSNTSNNQENNLKKSIHPNVNNF